MRGSPAQRYGGRRDSPYWWLRLAEEATPKVRHVPLPPGVPSHYSDLDDAPPMDRYRGMGAAGASAVRFVSIDPHCCRGDPERSRCAGSRVIFTVTTWIMDLSMDEPLTWVKDGVLDGGELWALPGYYEGLPRVHVECPVVSLENPDVVCFTISNWQLVSYEERMARMIEVDMRNKALMFAVEYNADPWRARYHLPAKFQC
ncbi:hypothetical protein ACP70R_022552 [Stipagrostis hirtigluma subsp. patula]